MRGLLVKDIKLMKNQVKSMAVMVLIALGMYATTQSGALFIAYLTGVLSLLTVGTISYDEFDNGYAFLFALPVSRKEYVLEKYLLGLLTSVAGCLFSIIVVFLWQLATGSGSDIREGVLMGGTVLLACYILQAVKIPVQLKFGVEKGRMAMIGVMVIFFGVLALIANLERPRIYFTEVDDLWIAARLYVIVAGQAVIGIVVMVVSYLISVRIIEKKEF